MYVKNLFILCIVVILFTKIFNVTLAYADEIYHANREGFEVPFPSEPNVNTLDNATFALKNFQSHSLNDGHFSQYNVYVYSLKSGKIFDADSIDAYFENAAGNDGILLKQENITYKGFKGTSYEVKVNHSDIDLIRRGITFFVDGDPIKISVLESANIDEKQSNFSNFKKSFKLQAIDIPMSDIKWSNGGIEFNPPVDWKERKDKIAGSTISVFSNESGISIELMRASLKEASCKDMKSFVKPNDIDSNGFFKTEFEIKQYSVTMKTLSSCIEKNGYTYILTGKAPKETFFRWALIFQNSLKTLG